jgi:hypothetical protein
MYIFDWHYKMENVHFGKVFEEHSEDYMRINLNNIITLTIILVRGLIANRSTN